MKQELFAFLFLGATVLPLTCRAAPEEIQVYLDDMTAPGHVGLDVHNNFVVSGDSSPAYQGGSATQHQYRLTPEFYYGITNEIELGMYILAARDSDGSSRIDGEKLRVKYIAPHDEQAGAFWGVNLEIGKTDLAASPQPWNAELKGIYGYRAGRWMMAVNPNLDWSLSSGGGPVTLDIDGKIAYSITDKTQLGLELYNEFGPVRQLQPWNQNSKTAYLALDHDFGTVDINAGVGRGLTSDSDKWVIKFILGSHF